MSRPRGGLPGDPATPVNEPALSHRQARPPSPPSLGPPPPSVATHSPILAAVPGASILTGRLGHPRGNWEDLDLSVIRRPP